MTPTSAPLAQSMAQRIRRAGADGDALVALAHEAAALSQAEMAEPAGRIMGVTLKSASSRAQEVAEIFVRAGAPISRPYLVLLNRLDEAATHEPGVARFMANRRHAKAILENALVNVPDAEAMSQKLRVRLARVLLQIGDEEALSTLVDDLARRSREQGHDAIELAKCMLVCMTTGHGKALREPIRLLAEQTPLSMEVLRSHVRGLLEDDQPIGDWWPRVRQAALDSPQDTGLKRFAAFCAYEMCDWPFAEIAHQELADVSGDAFLWEKAGFAALRNGHEAQGAVWLSRARPRVPPQQVGCLALPLAALLDALNRDYHWGENDHFEMRQHLCDSLGILQTSLASGQYSVLDVVRAGTTIGTVERYPFYVLSQVIDGEMYVEHWDSRYGTFDLHAYGIVWRALVEHQAVLFLHAIQEMLNGQSAGGLDTLRNTAERLIHATLALNDPEMALATLLPLVSQGCTSSFFEGLVDRCLLHQARITEVQERLTSRVSPASERLQACRVARLPEWLKAERLESTVLWEEEPREGSFEKATPDGSMETYSHRGLGFTLEAVNAASLMLAGSEVLVGAQGTVLCPSPWHYRGIFPERTGIARSASKNGVVLDLNTGRKRISDPVIILAGNDAYHVPNYFHWINFVLTRCVFLLQRGLIRNRRLLMPAEIKPWMRGALALIGLTEQHLLFYRADELLHIDEATIITQFDYPGAQYMQQFRAFMWQAAGHSDMAKNTHIFMGRPSDARRPFLDREEILRIAQEEGYCCTEPSELSVAEQVRLFSEARSVAGFGGGAFTNIAFCPPGMPALELTRRETTWPDYTGIALALNIRYRFCPGWIEPCATGTPHVHDAPTRFDIGMVKRELRRLKTICN